MKYPEINRFGLTEYHKERLCYPYTDAPAFTFWESPQEGESMRAWQDGRCALCGFRDSLVKDHCHVSGLVRGFLCPSCNVTEGKSDHNLASWRSGTTPAALMGIEDAYIDLMTGTPPPRYAATTDSDLDIIAEAAAR